MCQSVFKVILWLLDGGGGGSGGVVIVVVMLEVVTGEGVAALDVCYRSC